MGVVGELGEFVVVGGFWLVVVSLGVGLVAVGTLRAMQLCNGDS